MLPTSLLLHEKQFLQWILASTIVTEGRAIEVASLLTSTTCSSETLKELLARINRLINPFSLEVGRRYFAEEDTHHILIWNTCGDAIAQTATLFTPVQISALKTIVASIAKSKEASSIEAIQAVYLSRNEKIPGTPMTKSQIQTFINELVDLRWLHQRPGGKLAIGPRSLVELTGYLQEAGEGESPFIECCLCNELTSTPGDPLKCSKCNSAFHSSCLLHFTAIQQAVVRKCPSCKMAFEP